MNTITKKMILSLGIIFSATTQCMEDSDEQSNIDIAAEWIISPTTLYVAGGVVGVGVIGKLGYNYLKRRAIKKLSLENLISQFNYHAQQAQLLIQSHTHFKNGVNFDSLANTLFPGYPYPVTTYYKALQELIQKFHYYEYAFNIKKSTQHSPALVAYVDEYIQASSVIIMKLESLKEIVPHSKGYFIEKKAQKWPLGLMVLSGATGSALTYALTSIKFFNLKQLKSLWNQYSK